MCSLCELGLGGSGGPNEFHALPVSSDYIRRAAPTNVEASYGVPAPAAMPQGVGLKGRRTLIKGGVILSVDDAVGNFASGDVLIEGPKFSPSARASTRPTRP